MSNLYRGASKDAPYQVSIHLAKQFQRRIFFRTTQELEYLVFFPEFNIRLYDKNSESD
jgi:hypothetical protein